VGKIFSGYFIYLELPKDVDVFVPDRKTEETSRASIDSKGKQANGTSFGAAMNEDGRYVAFTSNTTNLVNSDKNQTMTVFVPDRETGETTLVSLSSNGKQGEASSFVGRRALIAFSSKATNLVDDDTRRRYLCP
jgi:Tol biopolymer transport system component